MFLQFEDALVVCSNALKNSVPIEESMVKNGYFCVLLIVILTVDIDLHLYLEIKLKKDTDDKQFFGKISNVCGVIQSESGSTSISFSFRVKRAPRVRPSTQTEKIRLLGVLAVHDGKSAHGQGNWKNAKLSRK